MTEPIIDNGGSIVVDRRPLPEIADAVAAFLDAVRGKGIDVDIAPFKIIGLDLGPFKIHFSIPA